jgi:carbon storage regulator
VVSDNIVITILDIHRDQVRVGITAPRDVEIHREEVYLAVKAANEKAAMEVATLGIDLNIAQTAPEDAEE